MNDYKLTKILKAFQELDIDEKQELVVMLKAHNLVDALQEVDNQLFRPSMKGWGYPDAELQKYIEACGEDKKGCLNGYDVIDRLRELYWQIIQENGVADLL